MTQQVRKGYRNHRKAAWGLVIALATLVAAVLIPIASGAPDKTYTLAYAAATQQQQNPSLTAGSLCAGDGGTVTLYLTNTAKTASLGSAQVNIPSYVSGVEAYKSTTGAASAETQIPAGGNFQWSANNPVFLQNLGLAKWGYVKLVLTVPKTAPTGSSSVTSVVKQSNNFNDNSTTANLFSDPSDWPTITVQTCTVTVSGIVYWDANSNGTKDGSDVVIPTRSVSLSVGNSTTTANTNGSGVYTFDVPRNAAYTVCVPASTTEAQTQPSGNTNCGTQPEIAGYGGTATAPASGLDFGITNGVVGTCGTEMNAPTPAGATSYDATLGSGSTCESKAKNQKLVFNTWTDSGGQYASLRPTATVPKCDPAASDWSQKCISVLETLTWSLPAGSDPKPLKYDDTFPYDTWVTMPYCKVDPTAGSFAPQDVLPKMADGVTYHTSCLISSSETLKSKTVNNVTSWYVERIDRVYSAQDGGRGVF